MADNEMPEWLPIAMKAARLGAWTWDFSDPQVKITRAPLYDEIMGSDPSQVWTLDMWRAHIYAEDAPVTSKKIDAILSGQTDDYDTEYRVHHQDGSIHWIHAWGKGIRDSKGKILRITGVLRDITDRKKLQQDREQFINTLSHDLRNPLAAAKANADILMLFPNRIEDRGKRVQKVISNILRADRMIQDLLDAARLRTGRKYDVSFEDCNFGENLCGLSEELSTQFGDRIRFTVDGDFHGSWTVEALRRAIENLVGNATKYGSTDSPITISLTRTGDIATIAVHNEGDPISFEDQKGLFDPFQRTKMAEGKGKRGWGLGLTIVRGVAEALNGRVEVRSAPAIGTTFSIIFPGRFAAAQQAA
jgi:PAS domain S-box-containing protein